MLIKVVGSGKLKAAGLVKHTFDFIKMIRAYSTFAAAKHQFLNVINELDYR
jgi:hypothetical protein